MEVERRARDSAPTRYRPRRPSQSVLYRCVQEHLETWLALAGEGDGDPVPAHVEREFRRYLECGILAHGFARARCGQCGHDFLIAFSCKGRGVCPSCNTRRMVATAAHLTDHVLPRLPVRQWVLAVPKRLRYFLHRDADLQGAALRVFLRVVEQQLRAHSPGAGLAARLGAVAFIHRFGSTLNPHLHFHCVVIDGVFDAAAAGGVLFHAASGLDANTIAAVQECVRRRLLRVFVHRGLLPEDAARAMAQWDHGGGFSVDRSVRIEAADRAGRERLLRYCARPRSTTVGDPRRRARADPRSGAPAHPGLRVRPAHRLVATTVDARTCATPGGLVPAAARLPARGHTGVSARAKVQRQACGAARCHRKSTLDPPHLLSHTQARVFEMAILHASPPGTHLVRQLRTAVRLPDGARGASMHPITCSVIDWASSRSPTNTFPPLSPSSSAASSSLWLRTTISMPGLSVRAVWIIRLTSTVSGVAITSMRASATCAWINVAGSTALP